MPAPASPAALGVSRTVLRILIALNWLMGAGITALLVAQSRRAVLARLLAIVDSVADRDAFVIENVRMRQDLEGTV